MSFKKIRSLPTPEQLAAQLPLSEFGRQNKANRDAAIAAILESKDSRFILIVGPCSADNPEAVLEYTHKLSVLSKKLEDKILIIPRIYTAKPRTSGIGYKGMQHSPDPSSPPNLLDGITATRQLHLAVLEDTGLSTADEILYPENWEYSSDLVSYMAIGARSVEDQFHRFTASGCDIPCGMKNPTGGNLLAMVYAIQTAQHPQQFIYRGSEVATSGNLHAHSILRGYSNKLGEHISNYALPNICKLDQAFREHQLINPSIIIDTNHSNSGKRYGLQPYIAREIIEMRKTSLSANHLVKGLMIESYLEDGSATIEHHLFGQSITDPCLGWDKTETLLKEIYHNL